MVRKGAGKGLALLPTEGGPFLHKARWRSKNHNACQPLERSLRLHGRDHRKRLPLTLTASKAKKSRSSPRNWVNKGRLLLGRGGPPRRDSSPQPPPAQAKLAHPTRGLPPRRLVQVACCPNLPLAAQEKAAGSHADHEGVEQEVVHEELEEVAEPRVPNPGVQVVALLKEAVPPIVDPTQEGEGVVGMTFGCGPTAAEDQEEQEQEEFAPQPGSSGPGAPVGGPLMRPKWYPGDEFLDESHGATPKRCSLDGSTEANKVHKFCGISDLQSRGSSKISYRAPSSPFCTSVVL